MARAKMWRACACTRGWATRSPFCSFFVVPVGLCRTCARGTGPRSTVTAFLLTSPCPSLISSSPPLSRFRWLHPPPSFLLSLSFAASSLFLSFFLNEHRGQKESEFRNVDAPRVERGGPHRGLLFYPQLHGAVKPHRLLEELGTRANVCPWRAARTPAIRHCFASRMDACREPSCRPRSTWNNRAP